MAEHGEMIRRVAADYGVQPRFIVAIIGLESDYGTYPIDEPLFDVVATLAFDGRRGAQFRASSWPRSRSSTRVTRRPSR